MKKIRSIWCDKEYNLIAVWIFCKLGRLYGLYQSSGVHKHNKNKPIISFIIIYLTAKKKKQKLPKTPIEFPFTHLWNQKLSLIKVWEVTCINLKTSLTPKNQTKCQLRQTDQQWLKVSDIFLCYLPRWHFKQHFLLLKSSFFVVEKKFETLRHLNILVLNCIGIKDCV